jgi:hypothetical protein
MLPFESWRRSNHFYAVAGSGILFGLVYLTLLPSMRLMKAQDIVSLSITTLSGSLHLAACLLGLTAYALSRSEHIRNLVIACFAGTILSLAVIANSVGFFAENLSFIIVSGCVLLCLFIHSGMLIGFVQVSGDLPKRISTALAASVGVFATALFLAQGWLRLQLATDYLRLLSSVLLLMVPIIAFVFLLVNHRKLSPNSSIRDALSARFRRSDETRLELRVLALMIGSLGIYAASLAMHLWRDQIDLGPASWILGVNLRGVDFSIVALFFYLNKIAQHGELNFEKQNLTAALASNAGKRFLLRHLNPKPFWAATAGLRAPSFVINHDPDFKVTQTLPASLLQIRNGEIQHCVNDLLGHAYLNHRTNGASISGTLDPEMSMRPCVDLLISFACLHLDAIPLVERRLSGLIKLLPILDESLARSMNLSDFSQILSRNLWMFHFDYEWIDQQLHKTPRETSYGVQNLDLESHIKNEISTILQSRSQLGSFIWITDQARERVIFEAPMLSSIIRAVPIELRSGDEVLAFLIRFEELIPRLQSYFSLDRKRLILSDYEPSPESSRFVSIVNVQTAHAHSTSQLTQILHQLPSFAWRGYREKDRALQAALSIYEKALNLIRREASSSDVHTKELVLKKSFIDVVAHIGYPSQTLHGAQQYKFAMRQPESILSNANQSWHPRFHEAWILLSSIEAQRYSQADLLSFIQFLLQVPAHKALAEDPFVIGKAIESLANIGHKVATGGDRDLVAQCFDVYLKWLLGLNVPTDYVIRLVDAADFVKGVRGKEVFSSESQSLMDEHLKRGRLNGEHPQRATELSALANRRHKDHQKNETKAS